MVKEKVLYEVDNSTTFHEAIMYEVFIDSTAMIFDKEDEKWKRVSLLHIVPEKETRKALNE